MYKTYFQNKKAVFFDLDGTIADTDPYWKRAFEKIMGLIGATSVTWEEADAGAPTPADTWENILQMTQIRPKNTIKELVNLTITELSQILKTDPIESTEGFWSLVADLKQKKYKLALVSNDPKDAVNVLLSALGCGQTFDLIVTADDVRNPKPAPDIYNNSAARLGLKASEVLVFEDSVIGSSSAQAAKMDTIVVWNTKVSQTKYPRDILTYISDFTSFPGNLDLTLEDYLKKTAEIALGEHLGQNATT